MKADISSFELPTSGNLISSELNGLNYNAVDGIQSCKVMPISHLEKLVFGAASYAASF